MPNVRRALLVATLVVSACSSSTGGGASTAPTAGGGGGGGGGSSVPVVTLPPGGGGGGGGSGIGAINTCALLTTDELKAAMGSAVKDGVLKNSDGKAECDWSPQNDADGFEVDIDIAAFDQSLWDSEISGSGIQPVPGLGEAAYRGFVSLGVLLIKKNGMEIDLAVIAPLMADDKMEAAQVKLAQAMLTRI